MEDAQAGAFLRCFYVQTWLFFKRGACALGILGFAYSSLDNGGDVRCFLYIRNSLLCDVPCKRYLRFYKLAEYGKAAERLKNVQNSTQSAHNLLTFYLRKIQALFILVLYYIVRRKWQIYL